MTDDVTCKARAKTHLIPLEQVVCDFGSVVAWGLWTSERRTERLVKDKRVRHRDRQNTCCGFMIVLISCLGDWCHSLPVTVWADIKITCAEKKVRAMQGFLSIRCCRADKVKLGDKPGEAKHTVVDVAVMFIGVKMCYCVSLRWERSVCLYLPL